MTAEESACNGAGDARKAELGPKVPVAASPEEGAAEDQEGDGVGGTFVIVNGDSDDLLDRGSDLEGKSDLTVAKEAPEANAAPDEVVSGDHGAAAREGTTSNAAHGVSSANGHDRAAVVSEVSVEECLAGQSAADVAESVEPKADVGEQGGADASTAGGHGHAVMGADSCAATADPEVSGDAGGAELAVVVEEEEVAIGKRDGEDASTASGHGHADTSAHSGAAATDPEVSAHEEHDGAHALKASGLNNANSGADSGTAVAEIGVGGEENKAERSAQDGADALMAIGLDHANTGADSGTAVAEPEVQDEESKGEQSAVDVVEQVEQEAVGGEDDRPDALTDNGHGHADMSTNSCAATAESEVSVDKSKAQQNAAGVVELVEQEKVSKIEGEEFNGAANVASNDQKAGVSEEPREEEVLENGHNHAEDSVNDAVELKPVVEKGEGGGVLVASKLEERNDNDSAVNVQDGGAGAFGVSGLREKADPLIEKRIDGTFPAVSELDQRVKNKSEEIVQDDKLAKDESSVGSLPSAEPESNPSVELYVDQKVQLEIAAEVENKLEPAIKADNAVELITADSDQTEDLETALEDSNIPLHINSVCEVEEKEVIEPACLEKSNLSPVQQSQQAANSSMETGEHGQFETFGGCLANNNGNDILEAELKPESEVEVNAASLQAAPAADTCTFHNEPIPLDLVDNDKIEHSSPDPELETCDHAQTEESDAEEKSRAAGDQVEHGTSKEHEPFVVDEAQSGSACGEESQGKSSAAVDQVEPGASKENNPIVVEEAQPSSANADESVVVNEAEASSNIEDKSNLVVTGSKSAEDTRNPHLENVVDACSSDNHVEVCNTSTLSDGVSSGTENADSSPINELASPTEEPCHSDGALEPSVRAPCTANETCPLDERCKDICSDNVNAFTKSSYEVETKCLGASESTSVDMVVHEEHKDDGEHVHEDEAKIIEDSIESPMDIDKSNKGETQIIRQQRVYIIKVPKIEDEDLWAKIQNAHVHLDQSTQKRDAINVLKQKQKAVCDEYREKLEAARQEEREGRAAHGDKKHDLNSVQSMIGKLNKANSIEEIDEMITRKNKIIQHEIITLKEEKLLIQEIKDLNTQRKQLCSNMGSKAEIKEALYQKDNIHERHKILKKDSDALLSNLKSLEEKTRSVQKAYDDERAVFRKLNEEHQAANEIRQKAYSDWCRMKAEARKKNKYFFMYKTDQKTASEYISKGDMEGLQLYCNNQVQTFLEIWNNDGDLRKQYVEANKISTLKRLGTSDGRRLGPNEDPPVIPSNSRRPSNPSRLPVSTPHMHILDSEAAPEKSALVPSAAVKDSFPVLHAPQITKHAKSKTTGSSSQKEQSTALVSEREDVESIEKEKTCQMEELELARKAEELAQREEELRKEKAAAEKEQLRLEQKAKAKEAEERKRRKAEKAQERAEYKAQKEAEIKEKKKAKKDRRRGTSEDPASSSSEGNTVALAATDTDSSATENTREADVAQQTASKRLPRPAVAMKQLNRVQPIPLPLRNRGKKKIRQYILAAVAVLSVLALFVAGNYIDLSDLFSLRSLQS